ncbi:LAMI_0A05314g1_1 [Lachancea mirantina]|uniref:LAMI_0A05314g1_1 n=1 Tax=Lachancea mirantina TaxID=1230905 RepID=A0A1G4IPH6_9SACH|nr:LAMI_0A05314g1_1 [Lachancea mirantina]
MLDEPRACDLKQWVLKWEYRDALHDKDQFAGFCNNFHQVFDSLSDEMVNDKVRLVLTDTLGIWIVRAKQVVEVAKTNGDIDSYGLWLAKLQDSLLTEDNCTFIFQYLIDFWSDGGPALTNSLETVLKRLLQILKLVYRENLAQLLHKWVSQILSLSHTLKPLYCVLEMLAPEIGAPMVFEKDPKFVEKSLESMHTEQLISPVSKCLVSLLVNCYPAPDKNGDLDQWFELWEGPIMQNFHSDVMRERIQIFILTPLFKFTPATVFERFVRRNFDETSPFLVPILKVGQELSLEEEPFGNDKLISKKFLECLLQDDTFKLSAFELLTYSPKRSQKIKTYVFDIVRRNLQVFFLDVHLKMRNDFHSAFKKFIDRVRDSTYSLNRDAEKLRIKSRFPDEEAEKRQSIKDAHQFLIWLLKFLMKQLAPGSQYPRKSLACKVLKTLLASGLDKSIDEKHITNKQTMTYPFSIRISHDEVLCRVLCDRLSDNYSDVRQSCFDLLVIASSRKDGQRGTISGLSKDELSHRAYEMLKIYRDCDAGAKILELLFCISSEHSVVVIKLMSVLSEKIRRAQEDFFEEIRTPVSGLFAAIALLLKDFEFKQSSQFSQEIINKSIELVSDNWNTVKKVLCEDVFEVQADQNASELGKLYEDTVINYAFRSVKESATLIGALVTSAPLNRDQISKCGSILFSQLLAIRHSGAFQSIIPSFGVCCECCAKVLPEQLDLWLKESLEIMGSRNKLITRRSGGIPYVLSNIVASAVNEGNTKIFTIAFERLVAIAERPVVEHEEEVDLPQVNAFNCIKVFFIDPALSQQCLEYINLCFELCTRHFTSHLWSLRNCSVMLFTALQNRLFGKVGKSVSARLFFARHKGVRETLLKLLESSVDAALEVLNESQATNQKSRWQIESIFLVLTVLSRMKSTPGYEGLQPFRVQINRCLSSKTWKLRELASKTLPLLTNDYFCEAKELWSNESLALTNQNKLHGNLMAIKELLSLVSDEETLQRVFSHLSSQLIRRVDLLVIKNPSFTTANAFVEVLDIVLKSFDGVDSDELSQVIHMLGTHFLNLNSEYHVDGTRQILLTSMFGILLHYEDDKHKEILQLLGLSSDYFEVQIAAAKFMSTGSFMNFTASHVVEDTIIELINDDKTWSYVKSYFVKALGDRTQKISSETWFKLIDSGCGDKLVAACLENLGPVTTPDDNCYWDLIGQFARDDSPLDLRLAALRSLILFTEKNGSPEALFHIYRYLSDDEEELRIIAAQFLNENFLDLRGGPATIVPSKAADLFLDVFLLTFPSSTVQNLASAFIKDLFGEFSLRFNSNEQGVLFELESDNQFRNLTDEGLRLVRLIKSTAGSEIISRKYIDMVAQQLKDDRAQDGFLGWGSDPTNFAKLCIARYFAEGIDCSLDGLMRSRNCHPLIQEFLPENI